MPPPTGDIRPDVNLRVSGRVQPELLREAVRVIFAVRPGDHEVLALGDGRGLGR